MDRGNVRKRILHTEEPPRGHLNLLGYVVCPLKQIFREGMEETLVREHDGGRDFDCFVPMGCGGTDPYENIWQVDSIDAFPDMVVSVGFDNLFKKRFMEKFIKGGDFQSVQIAPTPAAFTECGIPDPENHYTIYSIFPYIFLVDQRRLGTRPVPKRWSDLLEPVYRREIIIGGSEDEVNELLMLSVFKEYGVEGLKQLAANTKDAWHASKMAKTAGNGSPSGAAIYVMPWFFAKTCPRTEVTSIIWPEDGALANPMYLLVKKTKLQKLKPLYQYVTGRELGEKAAKSFFPVLHPAVDNQLPPGAKFKWLGWDYINQTDMGEEIQKTTGLFIREWKNGR